MRFRIDTTSTTCSSSVGSVTLAKASNRKWKRISGMIFDVNSINKARISPSKKALRTCMVTASAPLPLNALAICRIPKKIDENKM
ncbi:hypothetical protein D3C85_1720180 [compost metagenome]